MKKQYLITLTAILLSFFVCIPTVSAKTENKIQPAKQSNTVKKVGTLALCNQPPQTQVVNNSGASIYKVKVGTVEFSKNLSYCFNGCSTGFKPVSAGQSQVSVKFTKTSPWKTIGTIGKFTKCSHYAVNIIIKENTLCAVLALRQQTDSTYNADKTKKTITKTCTALKKTDLLSSIDKKKSPKKNEKQITPKMVKQNKQVFLQFPEPVINLKVLDSKGNVLQKFKKGKQFDITESVKKNGGNDLKLTYMVEGAPDSKKRSKPRIVPLEGEITYILSTRLMFRNFIETLHDIDRNEPRNNDINGSVNTITGNLSGAVGGDDPADYFFIKTSPSGYGTFFKITRTSGNINLHLYDPAKRYLDWNRDSVWIAVAPNTTFYVQVEPGSTTSTDYAINVEARPVVDPMEPNDSFATAKVHTTPGNKVLCNLFSSTGNYVGIKDYYKFNLPEEKLVRVTIGNAGLESGRSVSISLYDKDNTHHTTITGSTNGGTLEYDLRGAYTASWPPFPAGEWRILVTTHSESNARPYGAGNGPGCFTSAAGYSLNLDLID